MYVISFRRIEKRGGREGGERKSANERKLRDLAEFGGSWITVVNFETDDTGRGDKAGADRSLCCLEVK